MKYLIKKGKASYKGINRSEPETEHPVCARQTTPSPRPLGRCREKLHKGIDHITLYHLNPTAYVYGKIRKAAYVSFTGGK